MNKVEFRMAIPAVTREYTPGSCRNLRNPVRHPPLQEMRLSSAPLGTEQFRVPNQTRKSLNVLDGTQESPQHHCHKMRGTLLSPQECKIAGCTPSQLEMKPISPSLAP